MVEACSQLAGAPDLSDLPPTPSSHNESGETWQNFLSAHQTWLKEAARYRVQLTG